MSHYGSNKNKVKKSYWLFIRNWWSRYLHALYSNDYIGCHCRYGCQWKWRQLKVLCEKKMKNSLEKKALFASVDSKRTSSTSFNWASFGYPQMLVYFGLHGPLKLSNVDHLYCIGTIHFNCILCSIGKMKNRMWL